MLNKGLNIGKLKGNQELDQPDLFRSREDLLHLAYAIQEEKILEH